MAHLHNIYDSDIHFKLDSKTRTFSNETDLKLLVAQGDHNSEIFTFEIPRYIEQHDMLKCNRIEIHYINISSTTRDTSKDVYYAEDLQVSPEDENIVIFSWPLRGNATKYNGSLSFSISFKCLEGDEITYRWNTLIYSKISVGKSLNNAETIAQEYSDVLEKWKKEVLENINPTVTIDTELNEESDNAIANCTVAKKISQLSEEITNLNIGNFIDYDKNVKAINHRGYSTEAPENTIPAYILSKQKGFKYVECDISFTSDSVAVLLHDDTINRTARLSNGTELSETVNISDITYETALTYDFGIWKSSAYEGTKIATLEEFLLYCKGLGLHPYIELKSGTETQVQSVVDSVEKCGMKGNVTYISFGATLLTYIKNYDDKARLGYVVSSVDSNVIVTTQELVSDYNEVFIDVARYGITDEGVQSCIDNGFPLEIWTVNATSQIETMNTYITGVTSDNLIVGKILYNKYMTYTPPIVDEGVTLLSISATYSGGSVLVGTDVSELTGIVVNASYSDGTTATVTDYTISGSIVEASNTITISYGGKSTTITVIGYSEQEEVTLSSISATYTGGDVTVGTALTNLTGLTVTGTYSDGSTSAITGYSLSGEIVEGTNTITVSYGGKTTTFTVTGVASGGEDNSMPSGNFVEYTIDSSKWTSGYISGSNTLVVGSSQGEMTYDEFIPVKEGTRVFLANTNNEWTSSWLAVAFAKETTNGSNIVSRPTYSSERDSNGVYNVFTAPANSAYMRVCSRNLLTNDYYKTAKIYIEEVS